MKHDPAAAVKKLRQASDSLLYDFSWMGTYEGVEYWNAQWKHLRNLATQLETPQ